MGTHRTRKQEREERLPLVAKLYKQGFSLSQITAKVREELGVLVSKTTIYKDVNFLIAEWRKEELQDIEDKITLELQRIDMACMELWEQWEKSKTDHTKTKNKAIGERTKDSTRDKDGKPSNELSTVRREKSEEEVIVYGNPAYIAEIRQQLSERRKLLGLYAPEKRELTGDLKTTLKVGDMSDEEIEKEMLRIKKSMGNV